MKNTFCLSKAIVEVAASQYSLGDRVLVLANDAPVPFGARGTVIGLERHGVDVLFDHRYVLIHSPLVVLNVVLLIDIWAPPICANVARICAVCACQPTRWRTAMHTRWREQPWRTHTAWSKPTPNNARANTTSATVQAARRTKQRRPGVLIAMITIVVDGVGADVVAVVKHVAAVVTITMATTININEVVTINAAVGIINVAVISSNEDITTINNNQHRTRRLLLYTSPMSMIGLLVLVLLVHFLHILSFCFFFYFHTTN